MVGLECGVYHESEIDTKISPKSLELWAFQPIWGLLLCDYRLYGCLLLLFNCTIKWNS